MKMRQGRSFALGFLLLVTLALLGLSNIPLVYADDDAVAEEAAPVETAEAVVDATGDVQVDEPEPEVEDNSAAEAAAAAAAQAVAEAAAEKAAEADSAVVDEVDTKKGSAFVTGVVDSAKDKAVSFVDKAKAVTPEQMKKAAAGALGIWGVAAGAGWVMNNLAGAEE